jgi:hypothetical protein
MFRFTIRELLLLTIIAALSVAWWLERKSLNAQLAFMRTEKGPLELFHAETERLRKQLIKRESRGPLVHYLGQKLMRNHFDGYRSFARDAIKAREQLESDADAAGYIITMGREGMTLEPKWRNYFPARRPVSSRDET